MVNTLVHLLCCVQLFWPHELYSTPGFAVLHYLPEFAQTHVRWVSDAIQPSHPLLPPSPPALSLSQHQGLFQWVISGGQRIGALASASIFPMNIQGWFPVGLTDLTSLLSKGTLKGLLQHCISKASVLWHLAFFMVHLWHLHMTTGKTIALTEMDLCWQSDNCFLICCLALS